MSLNSSTLNGKDLGYAQLKALSILSMSTPQTEINSAVSERKIIDHHTNPNPCKVEEEIEHLNDKITTNQPLGHHHLPSLSFSRPTPWPETAGSGWSTSGQLPPSSTQRPEPRRYGSRPLGRSLSSPRAHTTVIRSPRPPPALPHAIPGKGCRSKPLKRELDSLIWEEG